MFLLLAYAGFALVAGGLLVRPASTVGPAEAGPAVEAAVVPASGALAACRFRRLRWPVRARSRRRRVALAGATAMLPMMVLVTTGLHGGGAGGGNGQPALAAGTSGGGDRGSEATIRDRAAQQVPLPTGDAVIPALALRAYRVAESWAAGFDPTCRLPWSVLAGIGRIESNHGRHFGELARFSPAGDVTPTILGPVLDGTGGTAAIRDTDGGRWDGDIVWDRAVGPMQFIPSTWQALGRDGNGDRQANPNNLFDAAVSAAGYLCLNSNGPMTDDTNLRDAIHAYNHSWEYVSAVITWANFYQQRAGLGSLATVPVAVGPPSSGAAAGTAAGGAGTAAPPAAVGVPSSPTSPMASRPSGAATTRPGSSQITGPGAATTGTTSAPATQPPTTQAPTTTTTTTTTAQPPSTVPPTTPSSASAAP